MPIAFYKYSKKSRTTITGGLVMSLHAYACGCARNAGFLFATQGIGRIGSSPIPIKFHLIDLPPADSISNIKILISYYIQSR